jgi:peptide/nickel transport system permease protein
VIILLSKRTRVIKVLLIKFRLFWSQFSKDKMGVLGFIIIAVAAIIAILVPLVSPYDPDKQSTHILSPPSSQFFMGTDDLGRDIFSRVLWGTRTSLLFGVVAAAISGLLGTVLGAIAGYYGGLTDEILSRIFEVVLMIPLIFLLILVIALFGSNMYFCMVIVGFTMWPWIGRIMRSQVLTIKNRGFVQASIASGASSLRVLFRHVVPNGIYPVVANITLQIGWAILTEAGISFLGLGDPNTISWGQVLQWGHLHMTSGWWMSFFPGITIMIFVLGFIMFGDGVNYALTPRMKERT